MSRSELPTVQQTGKKYAISWLDIATHRLCAAWECAWSRRTGSAVMLRVVLEASSHISRTILHLWNQEEYNAWNAIRYLICLGRRLWQIRRGCCDATCSPEGVFKHAPHKSTEGEETEANRTPWGVCMSAQEQSRAPNTLWCLHVRSPSRYASLHQKNIWRKYYYSGIQQEYRKRGERSKFAGIPYRKLCSTRSLLKTLKIIHCAVVVCAFQGEYQDIFRNNLTNPRMRTLTRGKALYILMGSRQGFGICQTTDQKKLCTRFPSDMNRVLSDANRSLANEYRIPNCWEPNFYDRNRILVAGQSTLWCALYVTRYFLARVRAIRHILCACQFLDALTLMVSHLQMLQHTPAWEPCRDTIFSKCTHCQRAQRKYQDAHAHDSTDRGGHEPDAKHCSMRAIHAILSEDVYKIKSATTDRIARWEESLQSAKITKHAHRSLLLQKK